MEQEQGGQGQEQPPTAVPPVADRPESISRSEWEDFRREVREALAAGRTPPAEPEPEKPAEPSVPVAPAPEVREPAPEPEKPSQPSEKAPEEWGSGLFFRGRRKREEAE
ncbi:hypothetical protein OG559_31080 (plasmid) [Micromonospora sp. NBC_01405]|uniref:hypothetical protein n=1 Tax=Micromonospora sp. NBC_01405 TaxID=2903589 RepID=UPI00324530F6